MAISNEKPLTTTEMVQLVRSYLDDAETGEFNELALRLFEFQFANNTPFRRYAEAIKKRPGEINRWQEIPAVPTAAFKLEDHPLTCGGKIARTFLTSGTTTEVRGAHHFPETGTYEHAISRGWDEAGLPRMESLFFAASAEEAEHSSLSHMFGFLGGDAGRFLMRDSRFCLAQLYAALEVGRPIFLMGTALAFLHFMESHGEVELPEGSRILETGGYKGTARELAKGAFYEQLSGFFGVRDGLIHNEYGMTELSSQAYAAGAGGRHRFPYWCRWRVLDPESGEECEPGKLGYLVIHDLANVHSVAGIRTQDFGVAEGDGSFTLIGRDPGALPRGCSRTIDHALS